MFHNLLVLLFTVTSFLLPCATPPAFAEQTAELTKSLDSGSWQEVHSLYQAGKLEEALRALMSQPQTERPAFYYNIGTLYLRLGKAGRSVAYLEKANRMRPHDTSILHNLQIARAAVSQTVGSDRMDPASNWLEGLADRVSLEEVRGTLGLLGLILSMIWIRRYLKTRDIKRTLLHPGSLFILAGFTVTATLYAAQRFSEIHPPAVCLDRETVRSGPGEHFLELAQVEAGSKLRLLGPTAEGSANSGSGAPAPAASPATSELWRQIRYSTDGIGWVRASSLLLL